LVSTMVLIPPTCFFFQAEDGIRDGHVTGVQTCALPILAATACLILPSCAYQRNQASCGGQPTRQCSCAGRHLGCASRSPPPAAQIGRASCRERVEISVGAVSVIKNEEEDRGMSNDGIVT